MKIESMSIPDVKLLTPEKYKDGRGFFVENFRQDKFDLTVGEPTVLVQENYSFSKNQYTVRGLHAQIAPFPQGKLVRCVSGKIRDVAIDARPGSSAFGQSVMVDLDATGTSMIWVPEGFLHGFLTLEPNTQVMYKCTNYFAPDHAISVDWQDNNLGLDWGIDPQIAILSDKDKNAQSFKDFELKYITSSTQKLQAKNGGKA